jgi:hypothetical protein
MPKRCSGQGPERMPRRAIAYRAVTAFGEQSPICAARRIGWDGPLSDAPQTVRSFANNDRVGSEADRGISCGRAAVAPTPPSTFA